MASQSNNTLSYSITNKAVAQFVKGIIPNLERGLPLTITITPVKYEDYSVITVIGDWSVGTEMLDCFEKWQTILTKEQGGSFLKEKEQ